ncbi:hypothetical protein UlMin_023968 [Ulmus minor]
MLVVKVITLINENNSVQCTQTKASIPQTKAMWNADNISKFCDLCVKEVEGRHRPRTHFSKQLIGKEIGLGWNIKRRTIDASDELVPNATKFCKEGITPDMVEKLDKMFMNITATGEYAWTPSSGVLPFEYGKNYLDNLIILENKILLAYQKKKKSKTSGAAKLVQQIDRLTDVVEGSGTSNVQNEKQECDIPQVIDVLHSLLGIEIGNELYFFCNTYVFFLVRFMSMKQPDLKLNWLKYHYGLGSSS